MKRFYAEQAQKLIKLNNVCVEVSACKAVGGGAV